MANLVGVTRLQKEYKQLAQSPQTHNFVAVPDSKNIFEWHFCIFYLKDCPYENGFYHGKLLFPPEYPMKPPGIMMITPSGRFEPMKRICLSISDFHPETWNPTWKVETIITALISFLNSDENSTGCISTSTAMKKHQAAASLSWNLNNPDFVKYFQPLYHKLGINQQKMQKSKQKMSNVFNLALKQARTSLDQIKYEVKYLLDLKQNHAKNNTGPQLDQVKIQLTTKLLEMKSFQRQIFEIMELQRKVADQERQEMDTHNLNLQSLLYEKDYFKKEIHYCKEFKTPQLQQSLKPLIYDQFKNQGSNISDEQYHNNIKFLADQLKERKELNEKYIQVQHEKREKEKEYHQKSKLVEEFPQILNNLENASLPIQEYLNVTLTEDYQRMSQANDLPLPLNTLYRKFLHFSKDFPQFCMQVEAKGDSDQIEGFYEKYDSKILHNPQHQIRANRARLNQLIENAADSKISSNLLSHHAKRDKSPSQFKPSLNQIKSVQIDTRTNQKMPGISDSSKRIKKDKKKHQKGDDRSQSNNKQQKQDDSREEGEEEGDGANGNAGNSGDIINLDAPFDIDDKPILYLADQYERFPLYIEIKISQNPHFFEYLKPFNSANTFSIEQLSNQSKEDIMVKIFPLVVRIFLIPELNILTIELRNENLSTDDILSKLNLNDKGKQLNLIQLEDIVQSSKERVYQWLHNLAGLYLDTSPVSQTLVNPQFILQSENQAKMEDQQYISTKLIISKIWQRLVSKSVLNLQIDQFAAHKKFIKEVKEMFTKNETFNQQTKSQIQSFKNVDENKYEMIVSRDQQQFRVVIQLSANYPTVPPRFTIECLNKNTVMPSIEDIPEHIRSKMSEKDYWSVELLRNPNQSYDANGVPLQPFFESVEEIVNFQYIKHINIKIYGDFLLSFQIQLLFIQLEKRYQ
eukprot:403347513